MFLGRLTRKPMESYKGRLCGCAPGTHAALVRVIRRHVSCRPGVLDLGAHAGALLLRLSEAGFTGLTGTDLDTTRFDVPGATFVKLELNQNFSAKFATKFGLITCTEVIEHLDSPRNFLVEARNLLQDDGFLALSFPNVAFWKGRCKFALKGELWGFGRKNYRLQRHIAPMTIEMLSMLAQEVGLRVVEVATGGSFATVLEKIVTFPVWGLWRLIAQPSVLGESLLCLLQKSDPDAELKMPFHYKERWQGIPDRIGLEG